MKKAKTKPLAVIITAMLLAVSVLLCGLSAAAEDTKNGNSKGASDTVTVTVNYYYYDEETVDHKGTSPYRPFVANMLRYSPAIIEQCPVIPGYKPYSLVEYEDPETGLIDYRYEYTPSVTLNFNKDGEEYNIFYKPANVSYSITLMKQNLTDDGYTPAATLYGTGLTGDVPKEFDEGYVFPFDYSDPTLRGKTLNNAFEGFTLMYYLPEVIAADGNTEFECYYDRNYYHVNFELGDGGFGSAPIYAPYEFTLSNTIVGTPKRPGFLFTGWSPSLEPYVSCDKTYTALWKEQVVPVSIIYKTADLKEEGKETSYSYWNDTNLLLGDNYLLNRTDYSSGQQPRAEDVVVFSRLVDDYKDAKARNYKDADYFEFDLEKTLQMNSCLQQSDKDLNGDGKIDSNDMFFKVNGDESTVITLYYSRKTYNLRFAYARKKLGALVYDYDTKIDTGKQYLLLVENSDKVLSTETDSYSYTSGGKTQKCTGLKTLSISGSTSLVYWHFDRADAEDDTAFYVWTMKDGVKKYLDINVQTTNDQVIRNLELVDETGKSVLHYAPFPKNHDSIMLYKTINGRNWYLNDIRDRHTIAAPSDWLPVTNGNKLKLLNRPDKIPGGTDIYISNRTYDGDDNNYDETGTKSGVTWTIKIKSVPEVTLPEGSRVKKSTYNKNYYDNKGNLKTSYIYYCLSLTAEYGEYIEDTWPADVLEEVYSVSGDPYRFGSWSSPKGSIYRNDHKPDHSNILGYYPTMSSDLMIDYEKNPVPVEHDSEGNEYGPIFYAWWGKNLPDDANIGWHGLEIFYEAIDDDDITSANILNIDMEEIDGKTYIKRDLYLIHCAHNLGTRVDPFMYEGVTIIPSEADGYAQSHNIDGVTGHTTKTVNINGVPTEIIVTKFHYDRKRSPLYFESKGTDIFKVDDIPYGQKLKKVKPEGSDDPVYPNIIAPGKYEFSGWYTSMQFFTDEYKVDWDKITMIDRAMKVYAYWKPKTFTVIFYNDESAYRRNQPLDNGIYHNSYGEKIPKSVMETVENNLHPETIVLPDGTTGNYRMVGWYYIEDGIEHAFDPETMTVPGNLHLYMKWTSEIPTAFTVNYIDTVTKEKIADPTYGYSFVGITKTFNAKVDDELYPLPDGSLKKYYPCVASSSILMKFNHEDNIKNMEYILRGNAPYRVRYVLDNDDGTETPIHEDLNVYRNIKSIVTERFKTIKGYIPKKYYIKLAITVSDEYDDENESDPSKWNPANVITFHYIKDESNMPFHIKYMLEDEENGTETFDGRKYREANYIDDIGKRNDTEYEPVSNYPGYTPVKYQEFVLLGSDRTVPIKTTSINENDSRISFVLDERYQDELVYGKEVHIYYNKKLYPVKISYTFTNSIIADDNPAPLDGETPEQARLRARQEAENAAKTAVSEWFDLMKQIYPDIQGSVDDIVEDTSHVRLTVYRIDPDQKFGSKYTSTAPDLSDNGISISDDTRTKSIIIGDDDPQNIRRNRIDFFYTEINYIMIYYEVVLPSEDGFSVCDDIDRIDGLLSINQQHLQVGKKPSIPSVASDNNIYRFIGWFRDEDCTIPADEHCVSGERKNILLPEHQYANDTYFYAKYDYRRGDLTITAAPESSDSTDPKKMNVFGNEYYEYIVRGKVNPVPNSVEEYNDYIELRVLVKAGTTKTIKSLPIGNYLVEQTKWSWRYRPDSYQKQVRVIENSKPENAANVTFFEKINNTKWLTGQEYYTTK